MATSRSNDPVVSGHANQPAKDLVQPSLPLLGPPVLPPIEEEEVSLTIRALATKEADALKDLGFDLADVDADLLFRAGTTLWDIGQANLQKYMEEAKKIPLIAVAASTHEAMIKAEDRKDHIITVADFRIDAKGWLRKVSTDATGLLTFEREASPLTDTSISQLRGFYDHYQTLQERAEKAKAKADKKAGVAVPSKETGILPVSKRDPSRNNPNAWLGQLGGKQARMRARTLAGEREIFAITGYSDSKRSYVPFDSDQILYEAAKLVPDGIRAEVLYDAVSARMRARCFLTAPIDIPCFNGVGRIHQIGFDLLAGDDGTAGIQVNPFVIRTRCRNATLVAHQGIKSRFRHVGTFANLQDAIANAISNAAKGIETVREIWATAAAEWFLDEETGERLSVEETITRLVMGEYIPMGGVSQEEAIENYVRAWKAEGAEIYSAQGIVMAIQRAAHEGSWRTSWADTEVEKAASELLYQPVYVLTNYAEESEESDASD